MGRRERQELEEGLIMATRSAFRSRRVAVCTRASLSRFQPTLFSGTNSFFTVAKAE